MSEASREPVEGVYARRTRLRRTEILQSAVRAFGARGFHKASLADIAGAAGITAAGLLHHFRTKEALLTELLQLRDSEDAGGPDGERPTGLAYLQHLLDTAERNVARRGITQLYAVLSAEAVTEGHPAQEWFRARYRGLRPMIVEALLSAREHGEIESDIDPEATATAIIAIMDGLQIQWLYEPTEIDMVETLRQAITGLVRPVRPLVRPRR